MQKLILTRKARNMETCMVYVLTIKIITSTIRIEGKAELLELYDTKNQVKSTYLSQNESFGNR
jgi:hypothetical protein